MSDEAMHSTDREEHRDTRTGGSGEERFCRTGSGCSILLLLLQLQVLFFTRSQDFPDGEKRQTCWQGAASRRSQGSIAGEEVHLRGVGGVVSPVICRPEARRHTSDARTKPFLHVHSHSASAGERKSRPELGCARFETRGRWSGR
ncbi:hypothetical protein EYF80_013646 [Liparis tanakae]|uniref:Uncharacterized protein n=1 Tax=Liparis tanakae TaxID=230148 RepID=A0A4Z2IEU7_9TELE|nr:hypothetical protein EYF80_013646 [Liparis tanakae]